MSVIPAEEQAAPPASAAPEPAPARRFNYRRLFWKWHLYAGLIGSPLLILIAVTGGILVFEPEIDHWLRPDLWVVDPAGAGSQSYSDQSLLDLVRERYPESRIFRYEQAAHPHGSCRFRLFTEGQRGIQDVWVNPHTREITGERPFETAFVRIIVQLHRRLLNGEPGSSIVELITGWCIVLCCTGLYMWWPRTRRQWRTALTFSRTGNTTRTNWRLHNTVGGWVGGFALILALTGMVFSTYSGQLYRLAMVQTGALDNPLSRPPKSTPAEDASPVLVDRLLNVVREETGPDGRLVVNLPRDETGSFVIYISPGERPTWTSMTSARIWAFDQYSGERLAQTNWDDLGLLAKVRFVSLGLHYGSIFGLGTRLLAIVVCLAIPVLSLTGFLIWWWKRDRQPAVEPATSLSRPPSKLAIAGITFLFVIFPTTGASFLVLAGYEGLRGWRTGRESA